MFIFFRREALCVNAADAVDAVDEVDTDPLSDVILLLPGYISSGQLDTEGLV